MQEIPAIFVLGTLLGSIVCEFYEPLFFKEEELRHVRDTSAHKNMCNDDDLLAFLAQAQITNPESIVGIAIADFDAACRSSGAVIKKIDKYLKNCTAEPGLYTNMISGLRSFDDNLCKNSEFYKKYDKYDKCISDLDNDYDSCDGVPDWIENEDQEKVCKTYKRIVDCYYIKTAKVCGIKAAMILKELMVDVIDCTIPAKCGLGKSPPVDDAMSDKYADSLNQDGTTASGNIFIKNVMQQIPVMILFYFIYTYL